MGMMGMMNAPMTGVMMPGGGPAALPALAMPVRGPTAPARYFRGPA